MGHKELGFFEDNDGIIFVYASFNKDGELRKTDKEKNVRTRKMFYDSPCWMFVELSKEITKSGGISKFLDKCEGARRNLFKRLETAATSEYSLHKIRSGFKDKYPDMRKVRDELVSQYKNFIEEYKYDISAYFTNGYVVSSNIRTSNSSITTEFENIYEEHSKDSFPLEVIGYLDNTGDEVLSNAYLSIDVDREQDSTITRYNIRIKNII